MEGFGRWWKVEDLVRFLGDAARTSGGPVGGLSRMNPVVNPRAYGPGGNMIANLGNLLLSSSSK
jgi:hypothetical protein